MTRAEFVAKATRKAEQDLRIPAGWWGTWDDINGPREIRIRFSECWVIRQSGELISKHYSRASAIAKARKL